MGGRGALTQRSQHFGAQPGSGSGDPLASDQLSGMSASGGGGHHHSHAPCGGCGSGFLMHLLGLDRFTKGKAVDGLAKASKASNPFDMGLIANCKDFWTAGNQLGVEYEKLYDVPPEGFAEARRRREMDEGMDDTSKTRQGLFMRMGLGFGGRARSGYEPVNQV